MSESEWKGTTYITTGNPNLKPEESISYEVGIDQKLAYGISTYASVYHTKVKNLIQYISAFDSVKWKNNDLFFTTEYGYVKTENDETGYELIRRPRQNLTLTAGLENEIYGLSASLVAKSHSKISESSSSAMIPGYATIDLHAYWNATPNIKLFTNIVNIGDVKYKTSYYSADEFYINGGRLASAGVTLSY